jgi:DNA-directed RNA polymerase specialized sigma24 family protein
MMEGMPQADIVAGPGPTSLEVLYRTEYAGMVRLAFTLVGTNTEAEEIVQDSFVAVARRFNELRQPGAYLRQVVVHRCHSVLRRRRLVQRQAPAPPPGLTPEADLLWDVLGHLSEPQRIAVVLRYYGGLRASEIAAVLDVPSATVRSHLRRALAALRKELGE